MNSKLTTLQLPHGELPLPAFLPDGTQGVVRAVSADDLEAAGVRAVQMNVYHLMQRPGTSTIQALGGLHRMAGWRGPIFTDSACTAGGSSGPVQSSKQISMSAP